MSTITWQNENEQAEGLDNVNVILCKELRVESGGAIVRSPDLTTRRDIKVGMRIHEEKPPDTVAQKQIGIEIGDFLIVENGG